MPRKKKYIILNSFERNDRRLIRLYARRAGMEYEEFAIYLKSLRDNPVTYKINFETLSPRIFVTLEKVAPKKRTFLHVFSDGEIRVFTCLYKKEGAYFNKEENYRLTNNIEKFINKTFKDSSLTFIINGVGSISSKILNGLYKNRELVKELLLSSLREEKPEFLKFTLRELYDDKNSPYNYGGELSDVRTAIINHIENRKEEILIEGLENSSVLDTTVEEVVSNYLIFQKFDAVKND